MTAVRACAAWLAEYREERASAAKLQDEVDVFMQQFDAEEARAEQEKEAAEKQVDDDGFQLVTRKRRRGAKQAEAKLDQQERKKKRQEKELKNFYSFQLRDVKKKRASRRAGHWGRPQRRGSHVSLSPRCTAELARLRAQFEEDKRRVAVMKQARKFKPF